MLKPMPPSRCVCGPSGCVQQQSADDVTLTIDVRGAPAPRGR